MATLASRPAGASTSRIPAGVAPLRAGQGRSFLWRRLHSLSGIFPVGVYLLEHVISNAYATNGANAYNAQVRFLTSLPFVIWLEVFFIYIPLLYHGLYGFYIWYRGQSNVGDYPLIGNWVYTTQRWTGAIAFAFMAYHTASMRFMGPHIMSESAIAFSKVQWALVGHPAVTAFYFIGVIAASWHIGAGVFLFCAKWGFITGPNARKRAGVVGVAVAAFFIVLGVASLVAFLTAPMQKAPAVLQQELEQQHQQPSAMLNH